jgi:hypothetical protein
MDRRQFVTGSLVTAGSALLGDRGLAAGSTFSLDQVPGPISPAH